MSRGRKRTKIAVSPSTMYKNKNTSRARRRRVKGATVAACCTNINPRRARASRRINLPALRYFRCSLWLDGLHVSACVWVYAYASDNTVARPRKCDVVCPFPFFFGRSVALGRANILSPFPLLVCNFLRVGGFKRDFAGLIYVGERD